VKVTLTIYGEPASKANSRQLVMFGHGKNARPALIKSEKARDYEKAAGEQLEPSVCVMMQGPVRVTMKIFYATERPDLDESVVLDVLQAKYRGTGEERVLERNGVYRNDRQVREKHVFHAIDRDNPRTEIVVEEISAGLFEDLMPPAPPPRPPARKRREPTPSRVFPPVPAGADPF
jgi:hypothetical protein